MRKRTYTFAEYKELQELNKIDRILGEIKKNKKMYSKLVLTLALVLNNHEVYAVGLESNLGGVATELISMILIFGRYGCLGMGIKAMIENMLQGANIKEATSEGLQYFIFFIVLNLYPTLFSMIKF